MKNVIKAILWDFGGVILTSPFEAFARYEAANGLPPDLIRSINSTNPDTNAWAKFERSDVDLDGFCELFEGEAAAFGHRIDGHAIMALLHGDLRPQMVAALHKFKANGYQQALLTNNVVVGNSRGGTHERDEVLAIFDFIIESSVVGFRKPEPQFYTAACSALSVRADECVFLDDLGINLKPAAAMGMRTIKVVDPDQALTQLYAILAESGSPDSTGSSVSFQPG
jgi:putative hydrolase of the HAD superfamily